VERAALALRFCLSVEGVATVIPGMLTRTEVLASVAACEQGPLERDVMQSVEGVYRRYEARLGF
jgi:aryl-alcohol dehydrogenase-like predicted oxidoreductase